MKHFNAKLIATTIGMLLCGASLAQPAATGMPLTKADYKTQKAAIGTDYTAAKAQCKSLAGNAKDICMAEAKGKESVSKATLEAQYKPSRDMDYKLRVAKADATHHVAREKCDDQAGNLKDVCVKEAKAARTTATADAKAQLKVRDARVVATDKTNAARVDAVVAKTDANYAVAIEKCKAFANEAKSTCVAEAKMYFGKS